MLPKLSPFRKYVLSGVMLEWLFGRQPYRYVRSFGWTLKDLRSRDVASLLLSRLSDLGKELNSNLLVQRSKHGGPIDSLTEAHLLEAIEEPRASSQDMGAVNVENNNQSLAIVLEWFSTEEMQFAKVRSVCDDKILINNPQELAAWTRFWKSVAEDLSLEYLYAVHAAVETKRRQLPKHVEKKIKRGEAPQPVNIFFKPARALPVVPWLLILGPRYVEHFTPESLESIDAWESGRLRNGAYWLQTAESPLDFGKEEVVAREQSMVEALGHEAFFDPNDPWRIGDGPDYPRVYKEWLGERPGGRVDVYVDEKGQIVTVERTEEARD